MKRMLIQTMEQQAVVPALKDPAQLGSCFAWEGRVVFVLCGDILTIRDMICALHDHGKRAIVHADLIGGLAAKEIAADYLQRCGADGIISTRPALIRRGRELGLLTVLRLFALDSKAVAKASSETAACSPDMIEILPATMPRLISRLRREVRVPLIAGGLLEEKGDILAALGAGALCVSTSDSRLWAL